MKYIIRLAVTADFERICKIYAIARCFMAKNGNPTQWGQQYPPQEMICRDIHEQKLYVAEDQAGIHGVFYFAIEEDPTYHVIEGGQWRYDLSYGVLHRVAGDGSGGILKAAVAFAEERIDYLRIDTHQNNIVMQNALGKRGFKKCGIVYMEDGSPRIAYDRKIV